MIKSDSIKNPFIKWNKDTIVLLFFSVFTLFLRWLTLMEVNTGGDNIDYWYFAKALVEGLEYSPVFHRSIRWGIILPTALVQLIFGTRAWVIYLPSLFMALLLNFSLYWVGKRTLGKKAAFLAIILLQFFPYTIRLSSQLFLALFSTNYILLSFLFLFKYLSPSSNREMKFQKWNFALSLFFMFMAYQTKITNLYFLFPWLIILWRKRNFKTAFVYGVILFGAYLLEHGLYFAILGESLGRLGIIRGTHFDTGSMTIGEGGNFDGSFIGLFKRYHWSFLPLYWHAYLWGGLLAGWFLWKKKNRAFIPEILCILGFFLFSLTFGIKSIRPVVPFEDFIARYFTPILPFLTLLMGRAMVALFPKKWKNLLSSWFSNKVWIILFLLPLFALTGAGLMLDRLPSSAREYLNHPFRFREHQWVKLNQWERISQEALDAGVSLATYIHGPNENEANRYSKKNLDTVNRLLLDLSQQGAPYPIHSIQFMEGDILIQYISKDGEWIENSNLWFSYRQPFEMQMERIDFTP